MYCGYLWIGYGEVGCIVLGMEIYLSLKIGRLEKNWWSGRGIILGVDWFIVD